MGHCQGLSAQINSVLSRDDDDGWFFAVQETQNVEPIEINHYSVYLNFVDVAPKYIDLTYHRYLFTFLPYILLADMDRHWILYFSILEFYKITQRQPFLFIFICSLLNKNFHHSR